MRRRPEDVDAGPLEKAHRELSADIQMVEEAWRLFEEQAAQEGGQRRYRAASPEPVRLIHHALRQGWSEAYNPASDTDEPRSELLSPGYLFEPSESLTSRFCEVVRVCYGAFTDDDNAPERAIDNFLKDLRSGRSPDIEAPGMANC
jgi:hypothetical protein